MPYATNKGADQPVHPRRLISAFVVRCLDSMISKLVKPKISRIGRFKSYLVSNPRRQFSRDEAHM